MRTKLKKLAKTLIEKAHESELYYSVIKTCYRPKIKCKVNDLVSEPVYIGKARLLDEAVLKTTELKPQPVVVKSTELDCHSETSSNHLLLDKYLPNVLNIMMIDHIIKWIDINTTFISTARNYPIQVFDNIQTNIIDAHEGFSFPKTHEIKRAEMSINRRLTINEEIITVEPYTKILEPTRILKVPVEKKPIAQLYFSAQQVMNFKDELAIQNNTGLENVEISAIYDKINSNIYSAIQQQPNSRKLLCFFKDKKTKLVDDTMYYLILGRLKDKKTTIKALVKS